MAEPEQLRLRRIEIDGLFGVYDHRIDLFADDRVTVLHGPNGCGKTTVLRLVDALLNGRFSQIGRVPFARMSLCFGDGGGDGSTLELTPDDGSGGIRTGTLSLQTGTEDPRRQQLILDQNEAEAAAARADGLVPHPGVANMWIDMETGESLNGQEVLRRYSRRFGGASDDGKDAQDWLRAFLEPRGAYFIDEHRLIRAHRNPRTRRDPEASRHTPALVASVVERSCDFQQRLDDALANYGRRALELGRTFPQRLVNASGNVEFTQLEARLAALEAKIEDLRAMGVLDESPCSPFDVASLRSLDDTVSRVMTLYIQDTEAKLAPLDDLAARTFRLLDNLNGKYRHKAVEVNPDRGLVAEDEDGQPIPLDALSSGEQHEFVLQYDMLFRVRPNSVVLIDEPELSLHVEWQDKFMPDLLDIVKHWDFDVVIATHSPYIVGERDDLMVGLGGNA